MIERLNYYPLLNISIRMLNQEIMAGSTYYSTLYPWGLVLCMK